MEEAKTLRALPPIDWRKVHELMVSDGQNKAKKRHIHAACQILVNEPMGAEEYLKAYQEAMQDDASYKARQALSLKGISWAL